ncbi:DUF4232 domain-containing protein [Spirillospora sp. NPDC127200]
MKKPALLLLMLATGCSTATAPAAAPAVSPSPLRLPTEEALAPHCQPGMETAMGNDRANAAMGVRAMDLILRNCGDRPLKLNGYPILTLLDDLERPLPVTVRKGTRQIKDPGPRPITLEPNETARVGLFWRNTVTRTDVPASNARYVEVAPRTGMAPAVAWMTVPIDLGNTNRLEITAWSGRSG